VHRAECAPFGFRALCTTPKKAWQAITFADPASACCPCARNPRRNTLNFHNPCAIFCAKARAAQTGPAFQGALVGQFPTAPPARLTIEGQIMPQPIFHAMIPPHPGAPTGRPQRRIAASLIR
jgi:hypothetical protein